jgi:hypothetical protein
MHDGRLGTVMFPFAKNTLCVKDCNGDYCMTIPRHVTVCHYPFDF